MKIFYPIFPFLEKVNLLAVKQHLILTPGTAILGLHCILACRKLLSLKGYQDLFLGDHELEKQKTVVYVVQVA